MTDSRALRIVVGKATFFVHALGNFEYQPWKWWHVVSIQSSKPSWEQTISSRHHVCQDTGLAHISIIANLTRTSEAASCNQTQFISARTRMNQCVHFILQKHVSCQFSPKLDGESAWTWWKHENRPRGQTAVKLEGITDYQCVYVYIYNYIYRCVHVDSHLPGRESSDEECLLGMVQSCYKI